MLIFAGFFRTNTSNSSGCSECEARGVLRLVARASVAKKFFLLKMPDATYN